MNLKTVRYLKNITSFCGRFPCYRNCNKRTKKEMILPNKKMDHALNIQIPFVLKNMLISFNITNVFHNLLFLFILRFFYIQFFINLLF